MSENEPEAPEAPEAPKEEPQYIDFDQFAAVELKAGKVMEAALHPDADRLLVLKVDVGEEAPRQLCAGIRADWEPETLVGRTVVVVANLKPRKLRGLESQGMLLAVNGVERVIPLGIDGEVVPGTRVT
ncbi:MAG: methionine--tRNA ligase subunit beta [Planctomycetes bacterium]|nr:methionine--tRNA ligase subunit beta [Planctomycetota bacterium]